MTESRSASGWSASVEITPSPRWRSRLPALSTRPQPVCCSPGTRPRRRTLLCMASRYPLRPAIHCGVPRPASGREPFGDRVRDLEIGVDVLHVVALVQPLDQLQDLARLVLVEVDADIRHPLDLGALGAAEGGFQAVADGEEILRRAGDLVALRVGFDVERAGLDRRLQHRIRLVGQAGEPEHALPLELEGDRVGLAQRPAGLGEGAADVARGAVAVVSQGLDDHRDAVGAVALVADLLVILALPGHGGALDGAVDGVAR